VGEILAGVDDGPGEQAAGGEQGTKFPRVLEQTLHKIEWASL
jgi:hypothetical protein